MSRVSVQKVQNRLRAEALAKVSCWAVTRGKFPNCVVVEHASDAVDANQKLCLHLDAFFKAIPDATGHDFEIRALRIPVRPGAVLDWRDEVRLP